MLISKNLHKKSSEVCIKTRSTPASLSFIDQVTKHTTVKWTIVQISAKISSFFRLKIFILVTLQNEGSSTGVVYGPGVNILYTYNLTTPFHRGPSMMLCQEVPYTAVGNLASRIPAPR